MKVIYKIAKAELRQLFCSPIAWLILIIFTIQANIVFVENMEFWILKQDANESVWELSENIFSGYMGMFPKVQQYLYLYIPLLTMGLISKEKSSGSIKLLFSSPINNVQIVLGKYAAMLVYTLILMAILFVNLLFASFAIKDFDMPFMLSAMLGVFLLISSYAAIGLFMSTLTSYQVVAAVATLALLTVLNLIGEIGQDIPIVRDVAYWLSLRGRSNDMLNGLICSEDIIYFLIIITMFIWLSIMKLNSERRRQGLWIVISRYAGVVVVAFLLGHLSSIPTLRKYYDATATKAQTLHPNSQKIMEKLDEPLSITAYVNLLDPFYNRAMPSMWNVDSERFRQFIRFKPDIEMKYVYYWDTAENPALSYRLSEMTDQQKVNQLTEELLLEPDMFKSPSEFQKPKEITDENNRFTRILESGSGAKSILRVYGNQGNEPTEAQIAAALGCLANGACRMAFLTGHGELSIYRIGERGFYNFTIAKTSEDALVNNGFDVFEINLEEQCLDTMSVDILVVSQMKEPFSELELEQIKKYLATGGNMLIAGEPGCQNFMNPLLEDFGVQFMPGRLMQNNTDYTDNLVLAEPTKDAEKISGNFRWMNRWKYKSPMLNAVGIDCTNASSKGVKTVAMMVSDSIACWNELSNIGLTETVATLNPEIGEKQDTYIMALRVSRQIGDKEQRIMVFGDTDWLTNIERSTRRNELLTDFEHIQDNSLRWLTYDSYPVDVERPRTPDNRLYVTGNYIIGMKLFFWVCFPLIMAISCFLIQIKRKRN